MSDKNNIMNDDEYQFPKDEYLTQSAAASADTGQVHEEEVSDEKIIHKGGMSGVMERFPILKSKKLYIFGGILVVLVVGMRMMHHGSTTTVAAKPAVVTTPAQPAVEPNAQLMNQLDSIKSNQEDSQGSISALKNHITDLDNKLDAAADTNAQLSQSVTMLAAQVKLLTQDVQHNTKLLTAKPKKAKAHKPAYHPKPITYSLRAVVPGRAWVDASNGHSYSVSVGDTLAQYGKIKAIDDAGGHIYTSSGKIIDYGSNDS